MKTHKVSPMTFSFWPLLAIIMIVTYSPSVRAQLKEITTTDSRDLTGATGPTRVIVTRTEQDGRTIQTRIVEGPSINGGYAPLIETEQQTTRLNPNAAIVVKRQYFRDSNGNRQLLEVTEEQRSTAAGGREAVVRTTSRADVNGHLQVVEREVQETVPTRITPGKQPAPSRVRRQRFRSHSALAKIEQLKGDVAEQQTTACTRRQRRLRSVLPHRKHHHEDSVGSNKRRAHLRENSLIVTWK